MPFVSWLCATWQAQASCDKPMEHTANVFASTADTACILPRALPSRKIWFASELGLSSRSVQGLSVPGKHLPSNTTYAVNQRSPHGTQKRYEPYAVNLQGCSQSLLPKGMSKVFDPRPCKLPPAIKSHSSKLLTSHTRLYPINISH